MKIMLMSAIMSLGLVTGALAGTMNGSVTATPNLIRLPMHAPDVMLPSPCGGGTMRAIMASSPSVDSPRGFGGVSLADVKCAGNSRSRAHLRRMPVGR